MERINNDQVMKEVTELFGRQFTKETIPPELDLSKISLVANVNPKMLRRINIVKTAGAINSTSSTIYTTPVGRDFYLVGAELSLIKDATATSTLSRIIATIDGLAPDILHIAGLTLTAQSEVVSITFPYPIKIDRNTNITINNSTNVGNVTSRGTIFGYEVDLK